VITHTHISRLREENKRQTCRDSWAPLAWAAVRIPRTSPRSALYAPLVRNPPQESLRWRSGHNWEFIHWTLPTHTHTPYFSSQLTVYNLSFRPIKREISVAKQTISATKKKHLDVAHWVTVYLWHDHPVYLAIYWWISFYLISFQAGQLLKSLYFHRTGQRTKVETQFPTLLLFECIWFIFKGSRIYCRNGNK